MKQVQTITDLRRVVERMEILGRGCDELSPKVLEALLSDWELMYAILAEVRPKAAGEPPTWSKLCEHAMTEIRFDKY